MDDVYRQAVEAGARPVAAPVEREWGGRSAYVADPEGHRGEIAWAPWTPFQRSGRGPRRVRGG